MAEWVKLQDHRFPAWETVLRQVGFPTVSNPLQMSIEWAREEVLSKTAKFPKAADPGRRKLKVDTPDYLWDRAAAWIAHGGSLIIDGPVGSGKTFASTLLAAIGLSIQKRQARAVGGLPENVSKDGVPQALYLTETRLLSQLEAVSNSRGQDRKALDALLQVDLGSNFLVLDEIASYGSHKSWFFRYLAQFIDDRWSLCHTRHRVNRFRQTIFISNVPVEDLEEWDPRSADRIRGLTLHWNLDHESRR